MGRSMGVNNEIKYNKSKKIYLPIILLIFLFLGLLGKKETVYAYTYENPYDGAHIDYTLSFIDGRTVSGRDGSVAAASNYTNGASDGKFLKSFRASIDTSQMQAGASGHVAYSLHRSNVGWSSGNYDAMIDDSNASYHAGQWAEGISLAMIGGENDVANISNYYYIRYYGYMKQLSYGYYSRFGPYQQWWAAGAGYSGYWSGQGCQSNGGMWAPSYICRYNGTATNWVGTTGLCLPIVGFRASLLRYPMTVYLDPAGGVWTDGSLSTTQKYRLDNGTYQTGGKLSGVSYPTRDGYDFAGWEFSYVKYGSADASSFQNQYPKCFVAPTCNYENGEISLGNAKQVTMKAKWVRRFQVAYLSQADDVSNDFADVNAGYGFSQMGSYTFLNAPEDWCHVALPQVKDTRALQVPTSYTNPETGKTTKEDITATGVGWSLLPNSGMKNDGTSFGEGDVILGKTLYEKAAQLGLLSENGTVASYRGAAVTNRFSVVHLYRVWNFGPLIEAYDLYDTCTNAQGGNITKDWILEHVRVKDPENDKVTLDIEDFPREQLRQVSEDCEIPITITATDAVGNITCFEITLHIVSTNPKTVSALEGKGITRFISEKYTRASEADGGPCTGSVWRESNAYKNMLQAAFSNEKNNTPIKTISVL